MRKPIIIILFSIAAFLAFILNSSAVFSQYEFVKNKRQWHENTLYKVKLKNGAIFLENSCITYNFFNDKDMNFSVAHHGSEGEHFDLVKHFHAYKVHFRNSNKMATVVPFDRTDDYENYYIGSNPSKWASFVPKYREIIYQDIYDGIDFKFYNDISGLKYDFIVKPGANPLKIQLEYEGVDNLLIEDGNLVVYTTVANVMELEPYAYQIINEKKREVQCNYVLKRNRLSFEFPEGYNNKYELVVDPSLVFSTYTGSTGDNWGFTATWDYNDNVFSGGIVFDIGYPSTTGSYQINFAGGSPSNPSNPNWYANGCDIGIIKYNEDGTQRLFATYLGGTTGQEMPHSLVVTEQNDLLIMGTTGSSDFPTSSNGYRTFFIGGDSLVYDNVIAFPNGCDIFVAKLSSDGSQLLGGTYLGGSSNDGLNFRIHYTHPAPGTTINYVKQHGNDSLYANYGDGARGEIIVDDKNFVYVGTTTFSNDFSQGINPGFQPNSAGGQEGIAFKMNQDLSQLLWSSYLGGSQDDAIFSIALNDNYDVLVAGATVSNDFPTTAGSYSPTFNGGNTDAFLTKIHTHGSQILSSTFYGSNQFDNAFFVRTDRFNNVFICGQTKAQANSLIFNADYAIPNSGQYIAKFNPNLSDLVWSTTFGTGNGRPNIAITAFAVDVCDRIYLSGWGRDWPFSYYNALGDYYTWEDSFGTKGMEVTTDALQSETDGMDFYVLVLSDDASELEYATFFGELRYPSCSASGRDHVDGGTSRFDKKGHIIQSVCASCGGCQQFPTHPNPGVWSTSNNASNCNNAVFKIRIIEHLAAANFDPVPAGCMPYFVQFSNNSQGDVISWDFGDGSPLSTETNPSHTYSSGGSFIVTLIVNDPLSCNINDTITRVVNVIEPTPTELPDITICPGEQTLIGPEQTYPAGTTFIWQGGNLNNNSIKNPVASPSQTTDYLLIADGVCVDSVWQTVIIYEPDLAITVSDDMIVCPGENIVLTATTTGEVDEWQWSDSPNFTNILANGQSMSLTAQNSGTYYVRARENICNTFVVEQVYVEVHEFNYTIIPDQIICEGDQIQLNLTNYNPTDELSFSWSPQEFIVSGGNSNAPVVAPESETTFTVIITNQIGCETTDQVTVDINFLMLHNTEIEHNPCYDDCLGSASVSATGISPYSYLWSNNSTGESSSNLCAGNYSVTVIDALGCEAEIDLEITQPPMLVSSFTSVQVPECDGVGYGAATINASGGTPGYSYHWSFGGVGQTNNTLLVGMNYVTITDANNCQRIDSVFMPAPGDLVSAISDFNMVSCYGYCDGSISITADLGLEPYQYYWSDGSNTNSVSDLCPGQYVVTVIDADNCVTHQQMWISQPDSLIANANALQVIACYNETGNVGVSVFGGTFPYTYNWSNGSDQNNLIDVPEGSYYVTVTDINGCEDESEVYLSQPPELIADTLFRNMLCDYICNGLASVTAFGGTPPYSYDWSNGESSSSTDNLCQGDYSLTLTDANGCAFIKDFYIDNLNYIPSLDVDADKYVIYEGEEVNLIAVASEGSSYIWDPTGSLDNHTVSNPVATPEHTTVYEVEIIDENGCRNQDTIRILVKDVICGDPFIFVPNAFTPNGDGVNDHFMVMFPPGMVTHLYLAVYNRWGEKVFETDDMTHIGWDGTFRGKKLGMDVFVYQMRAKCLGGLEYSEKGNVTLLR